MSGGRVVLVDNSDESFSPTDGGAIATCLWEVARAAVTAGHPEPWVVTTRRATAPYSWPALSTVRVRADWPEPVSRVVRRLLGWSGPSQLAYARAVAAAVAPLAPDVLVCNNDPQVAVYLARRFPRTRVVHWFHNLERSPDRWRRRYAASGVRSHAVSGYLARAVEHLYALAPLSVTATPNGVDADRFSPRPGPTEARVPVLGFVGRVAVEKAPDVFLDACLELAARGAEFAVLLVGDTNWGFSRPGPYRDRVDELCTRLAARGVPVERLGHLTRDQVPEALRRFDVQVVPSRWDEPFGLVAAEGLATGLPVVATAVGGLPEVLGNAGHLVPREDPTALADALERLLADPADRADLGARARQRAEQLSWAATWAGLLTSAGVDPSRPAAATDAL